MKETKIKRRKHSIKKENKRLRDYGLTQETDNLRKKFAQIFKALLHSYALLPQVSEIRGIRSSLWASYAYSDKGFPLLFAYLESHNHTIC